MKDFMKVSPLKILEKSSRRALGRGNLGVLMARAGVGKTACLIHIAFDKLFRKEKLVHVSLEDIPEKITSYYNVIFYDLVKALNMDDEHEIRMLFERNRMILAYLQQSFEVGRLRENLKNLVDKIDFVPDTLIVDGLDFEEADRELIEGLKEIASQFNVEIWFSALTHRHITDVNERGIPHPCDKLDDLFNIIIQLQPSQSGLSLKLLKDHEMPVIPEAIVRLDPNTFLAMS
jgi:KaiC/GvpD/RAD55 family RecA-like ATPase